MANSKKSKEESSAGGSSKTEKKQKSSKKRTSKNKEAELKKKLYEAQKEIDSLQDQLLRRTAEIDNMRKRTEREVSRIIQSANRDLIRDILSVVDDFERSLEASKKESAEHELLKGVELIHQKLMSLFSRYGLTPIESVGQPFDVE